MKRLTMLHTINFLAEMMGKLAKEHLPRVEIVHMVDEGIVKELMAAGTLTPKIVRRVATQTILASETGADLILFTCSSTSPAVDTVRNMVESPILKIDDPMAEMAVATGRNIGVIASVESALPPGVNLIRSWSEKLGKEVRVTGKLINEAFQARLQGDIVRHDEIVRQTVEEMARDNDVVVLAQASMAHIAKSMEGAVAAAVLTSPDPCMQALKRLLES